MAGLADLPARRVARRRDRLYRDGGLLLYGGATVPRARGRGAYRALIRARWDDAVSGGSPALITQGGSMSRPILERLGFEPVGHVHMLVDDFGPSNEERKHGKAD